MSEHCSTIINLECSVDDDISTVRFGDDVCDIVYLDGLEDRWRCLPDLLGEYLDCCTPNSLKLEDILTRILIGYSYICLNRIRHDYACV
jgi:hypothetical protein